MKYFLDYYVKVLFYEEFTDSCALTLVSIGLKNVYKKKLRKKLKVDKSREASESQDSETHTGSLIFYYV